MLWAKRLVASAMDATHTIAFGYHPTEPRIYVTELDANGISLAPGKANVIVSIGGIVHASNVAISGENTYMRLDGRNVNTPVVFQLEDRVDKEYSISPPLAIEMETNNIFAFSDDVVILQGIINNSSRVYNIELWTTQDTTGPLTQQQSQIDGIVNRFAFSYRVQFPSDLVQYPKQFYVKTTGYSVASSIVTLNSPTMELAQSSFYTKSGDTITIDGSISDTGNVYPMSLVTGGQTVGGANSMISTGQSQNSFSFSYLPDSYPTTLTVNMFNSLTGNLTGSQDVVVDLVTITLDSTQTKYFTYSGQAITITGSMNDISIAYSMAMGPKTAVSSTVDGTFEIEYTALTTESLTVTASNQGNIIASTDPINVTMLEIILDQEIIIMAPGDTRAIRGTINDDLTDTAYSIALVDRVSGNVVVTGSSEPGVLNISLDYTTGDQGSIVLFLAIMDDSYGNVLVQSTTNVTVSVPEVVDGGERD
jgi:hypothetical protein